MLDKLLPYSPPPLQVAEKLMLAHCEQELAQRAKIVSETRATVQLPPFAQVLLPAVNYSLQAHAPLYCIVAFLLSKYVQMLQVMQQISDHVRQEFSACRAVYHQPPHCAAQGCVMAPSQATAVHSLQQPGSGYGQYSMPGLSQIHPSSAMLPSATLSSCLHQQPATHLQASRPLPMHTPSMHGQLGSAQQVHAGYNTLLAAQHQTLACDNLASESTLRQANAASMAYAAASGTPQLQAPAAHRGSLQQHSSATGLHGAAPWQHSSPLHAQHSMPHSASAAAPASTAARCTDQLQLHILKEGTTADGMPLSSAEGDGQRIISSQPSMLTQKSAPSMPSASEPNPLSLGGPLCPDQPNAVMPQETAPHVTSDKQVSGLEAAAPARDANDWILLTQELTASGLSDPALNRQQLSSQQPQQHLLPASITSKHTPHALAEQPPGPANTAAVSPPGPERNVSNVPSAADGFSSLLHAAEQGQPVPTSRAAADSNTPSASYPACMAGSPGAQQVASAAATAG